MGPHVAQVGPTPQNPWGLLAQNRYIEAVKNAGDPALIDFLDYYNSNYYMPADEAGVQATAGYYHGKNAVSAPWVFWTYAPGVKQDGKPIWYSETGGEESNWINGSGGTVGDGAITVALKMFNALVHSNATAYLYWQFSDGGSSITEHTLLNGSSLNNPLSSNKYVAFNHFSRFVRPGAIRVGSTFSNGKASIHGASEYDTLRSINVSAFLHEEDATLTYVLLNLRNSSESITIDLPDEISFEHFQFYRSSETEKLAQLADTVVQDGQITFSMPRYSLVTLVGNILVPPVFGDYNRDGFVDAADYAEWKTAFGSADPWIDGNKNGTVDTADYVVWRKAAGQSMGMSNITNVALPEPNGILITCFAFAVAALSRSKSFH
jgi:hypothetical protein